MAWLCIVQICFCLSRCYSELFLHGKYNSLRGGMREIRNILEMIASRRSHNTLRIDETRKRISVQLADLSSFGHFKGMHFQENIRYHRVASLLEWKSSSLWLPWMLQEMVFHSQRCRVFHTRCHWRCSLHGTWKWRQKELIPSTSHWRSLWENPQGYCSRGILGRQLC